MVRAYRRRTRPKSQVTPRWTEEDTYEPDTTETGTVWTSKEDPRVTVEVHTFWAEGQDEEGNLIEDDHVEWYVYPAYDGRGMPNSPYTTDDEDDAYQMAEKLKRLSLDQLTLRLFDWKMVK